jgi:hypothetical protein
VIPLAIENSDRYVGGAYLVFLLLLLIYVAIMAAKLQRLERELRELAGFAEQRRNGDAQAAPGRGGEAPSVVGSATPGESGGGV